MFEPSETGGYGVFVPALPGCYSQGETLEEAQRNIREAIELHVEALRNEGDPIHQETTRPVVARVRTRLAI